MSKIIENLKSADKAEKRNKYAAALKKKCADSNSADSNITVSAPNPLNSPVYATGQSSAPVLESSDNSNRSVILVGTTLILISLLSIGINYNSAKTFKKFSNEKKDLSLQLNNIGDKTELLLAQIANQEDKLNKIEDLMLEQKSQAELIAQEAKQTKATIKLISADSINERKRIAEIEKRIKSQQSTITRLDKAKQKLFDRVGTLDREIDSLSVKQADF